jgi:hypothetical protein
LKRMHREKDRTTAINLIVEGPLEGVTSIPAIAILDKGLL